MKKLLIILAFCLIGLPIHADEGMWLLKLMEEQHLADSLKKAGLKISPQMLFREDGKSFKNVVGIFDGGCTGEIVSSKGLIFTNNHCGFGYINDISTVQHNYLRDGFFAKSTQEELHCPGLSFTFILGIDNITKLVEAKAKKLGADVYTMQSQAFLSKLGKTLLKKSPYSRRKGTSIRVVPFYGGNMFFAFYMQKFPDVRLVADPPIKLAQFGDNMDNWIWPRHNVDFCAFRIYADSKGNPAEYSKNNVPLNTPEFLHISTKGINKNDFTMVMGFPGRTERFLTSDQIRMFLATNNVPIVTVGQPELAFNKKEMERSDSARLALQDENMMLANVVKKYDGMLKAAPKVKLIEAKEKEEKAFMEFAQQVNNPSYKTVIGNIASVCKAYTDSLYEMTLFFRSVKKNNIYIDYNLLKNFKQAFEKGNAKQIRHAIDLIYNHYQPNQMIDFNIRRMALLLPLWEKYRKLPISKQYHFPSPSSLAQSIFISRQKLEEAIKDHKSIDIDNDPLYLYSKYRDELNQIYIHADQNYKSKITALNKIYIKGLMEMYNNSKAPDANFTLRMTYGHVDPYSPRDAVYYDWHTTLKGMMEKADETIEDYRLDKRVAELYSKREFGRYARQDGELPTCFITNNDITGGNSGSPVMNDEGKLIGLAFDGNIESMTSDMMYNPKLQRCICVDIRYVLWTLDIYGGSKYLFDELVID